MTPVVQRSLFSERFSLARRSRTIRPSPGSTGSNLRFRSPLLRLCSSGSACAEALYDFDWGPTHGRWHSLVHGADDTLLSTKRAGGFVGAVFGLYAHDGTEERAAQ